MSRASEREKNKCFDEYGSVTFRPLRKLRQTDHPANQRDIRGYRNVTLPKMERRDKIIREGKGRERERERERESSEDMAMQNHVSGVTCKV